METTTLVHMANQIAAYFKSYPQDEVRLRSASI
jgi:NADH-dependant formate dehydrogenase delta subunit FdsD